MKPSLGLLDELRINPCYQLALIIIKTASQSEL